MFELYGIGAVALIVALVEVFKKVGLPVKYAPLVSLAVGVCLGIVAFSSESITKAIILGLAAGASAVGAYSGTKNLFENRAEVKDNG